MDVSVIIVNYNTTELLLSCINSVLEHTHGVSYEIIVADNGSSDSSLVPLRADKRLRLVELGENLGFGRANNAGAAIALGDHLFLLNPDTLLVNDAITILFRHLKEHPQTGICGGNLFDSNMQPVHSHHMQMPSLLSEADTVAGHLYAKLRYGRNTLFNHTGENMHVAAITGADMMIRREAWEKTGGFDPAFFMYFEDTDLCLRVKKEGYDIVNVPQAHIIHLEGKSFGKAKLRAERFFKGRHVFFHKHYPPFYNTLTDAMNITTIGLGTALSKLLGRHEKAELYRERLHIYRQLLKSN